MNDIQRAQAKKKRRQARKASGGSSAYGIPVLNEDVAKESDNDCKECGGSGIVELDEEAVCACAAENFQRRRGHQVQYNRHKTLVWLPGCPKG